MSSNAATITPIHSAKWDQYRFIFAAPKNDLALHNTVGVLDENPTKLYRILKGETEIHTDPHSQKIFILKAEQSPSAALDDLAHKIDEAIGNGHIIIVKTEAEEASSSSRRSSDFLFQFRISRETRTSNETKIFQRFTKTVGEAVYNGDIEKFPLLGQCKLQLEEPQ